MCQSLSMPYFGQLYSSRLKDAERAEVYAHASRLREKILAAGSDLVSTHRGKEVVIVFNRHRRGLEYCMQCRTYAPIVLMSKVFQGKVKKLNKINVDQFHQF